MSPHVHHFVYSLDVTGTESRSLRAVHSCAGRIGAAALSPEGASPSFEAARQEAT